jgi:hypothetical protein
LAKKETAMNYGRTNLAVTGQPRQNRSFPFCPACNAQCTGYTAKSAGVDESWTFACSGIVITAEQGRFDAIAPCLNSLKEAIAKLNKKSAS